MARFRKPLAERLQEFRRDETKRNHLRKALSHPDVQEALSLVQEVFLPTRAAQLPANDSMVTLMALNQSNCAGAHEAMAALFTLCDEPSEPEQPPMFEELLQEGDPIPGEKRRRKSKP